MPLQPNTIGPKSLYLNPASDKLTTADFAAIDAVYSSDVISPYAYTATVRDDYDAFNFLTSDAGSDLIAGSRVAFGLFLSPENDKGNFLFQLSGKAHYYGSAVATMRGSFFFGRKATNNTVVSSKAGVNNTLALSMMLPSTCSVVSIPAGATLQHDDGIESELFSLKLVGGFVYCFGYVLDNNSGANCLLKGGVSLSVRKYTTPIDTYRVSGSS